MALLSRMVATAPLVSPTTGRVRVVVDTDTANEVDDQFALAHLLWSPDRVDLEGLYAAPYSNERSSGPGDGMERSYAEIQRILALAGTPSPPVRRGSTGYLGERDAPLDTPAVRHLIERALAPADAPLYVLALAALTNVASALLLEPAIAGRVVIVWLGGHAPDWSHHREFNLSQDPPAARVVLQSPAPLVQVPCFPVASHLLTTVAELELHFAPRDPLARELTALVRDFQDNPPGWSKTLWDLAASAWVLNPAWAPSREQPRLQLTDAGLWQTPTDGRRMRVVEQIDRDAILGDLFHRAALAASPTSPFSHVSRSSDRL